MLPRQLCVEIDELRFRMDQFEHILDKYTMFNMDGRGVFLTLTANEILLGQYLRHANDRDTFLNFQDNNIQMDVGGKTAFYLDDTVANVLLGADAGAAITTGDNNTLLGFEAGSALTNGNYNVAIGREAMSLAKANMCIAIGREALQDIGVTSDGLGNIAVGYQALKQMDTGDYNVAIGLGAMSISAAGDLNIAIGMGAMQTGLGNDNIAIGQYALINTEAASQYNISIGSYAMTYNTTGDGNIGIGQEALRHNNAGNYNVAIGQEAGFGGALGAGGTYSNNVLIGYQAGYDLDAAGNDNVILGYQAGLALTTGTLNVFLGYLAGSQETTGSHKLFIDNTNTATPLIYGEFDNDLVKIHGDLCLGTEDGLGRLNFTEGTTIADGIVWGSDANKVTLYRSADDVLKTDDSLTVTLELLANKVVGDYSNDDIAASFGGKAGIGNQSYIIGNTLNAGFGGDTDDIDLWVNYRGYDAAVTRFRDFLVGDGKGVAIATFTGSTGNLTITGKMGVKTSTIPHGGVGYATFAIDGPNASATGPHVQITTDTDNYPLLQVLAWTHDNINLLFDVYYDGAFKSSDAGSNFLIAKNSDQLQFNYDSGVAAGAGVGMNIGFMMNASGGIFMYALKSGANQGAAGAAANELWVDTDDQTIKLGT